MEDQRGIDLPQRHREHGEGVQELQEFRSYRMERWIAVRFHAAKIDSIGTENFSHSVTPATSELLPRALCVSVVNQSPLCPPLSVL
jgi:hypothetical protein